MKPRSILLLFVLASAWLAGNARNAPRAATAQQLSPAKPAAIVVEHWQLGIQETTISAASEGENRGLAPVAIFRSDRANTAFRFPMAATSFELESAAMYILPRTALLTTTLQLSVYGIGGTFKRTITAQPINLATLPTQQWLTTTLVLSPQQRTISPSEYVVAEAVVETGGDLRQSNVMFDLMMSNTTIERIYLPLILR